jgi:hypothetical protein
VRRAQAQRGAADAALRNAAELTELARHVVDTRQAQAQHDAEREEQRQLDEPAPARWPDRDPGYQRPGAERAQRSAALLAAQDFPAGPEQAVGADRMPAQYEPPSRRSRQAERDEPEASP